MICMWTKNSCDPKGKYCKYLDRTFERTLNESCEHLIPKKEDVPDGSQQKDVTES